MNYCSSQSCLSSLGKLHQRLWNPNVNHIFWACHHFLFDVQEGVEKSPHFLCWMITVSYRAIFYSELSMKPHVSLQLSTVKWVTNSCIPQDNSTENLEQFWKHLNPQKYRYSLWMCWDVLSRVDKITFITFSTFCFD